jgi:hypothetical protein
VRSEEAGCPDQHRRGVLGLRGGPRRPPVPPGLAVPEIVTFHNDQFSRLGLPERPRPRTLNGTDLAAPASGRTGRTHPLPRIAVTGLVATLAAMVARVVAAALGDGDDPHARVIAEGSEHLTWSIDAE